MLYLVTLKTLSNLSDLKIDIPYDCSGFICVNINSNEKFLISKHFQDKCKSSKGYFHVENPGKTHYLNSPV